MSFPIQPSAEGSASDEAAVVVDLMLLAPTFGETTTIVTVT